MVKYVCLDLTAVWSFDNNKCTDVNAVFTLDSTTDEWNHLYTGGFSGLVSTMIGHMQLGGSREAKSYYCLGELDPDLPFSSDTPDSRTS